MDKIDERQDELFRVLDKIKMRETRSVIGYVTKHRKLCKYMINARCNEIINDANEKVKMRFILNVLKGNPD